MTETKEKDTNVLTLFRPFSDDAIKAGIRVTKDLSARGTKDRLVGTWKIEGRPYPGTIDDDAVVAEHLGTILRRITQALTNMNFSGVLASGLNGMETARVLIVPFILRMNIDSAKPFLFMATLPAFMTRIYPFMLDPLYGESLQTIVKEKIAHLPEETKQDHRALMLMEWRGVNQVVKIEDDKNLFTQKIMDEWIRQNWILQRNKKNLVSMLMQIPLRLIAMTKGEEEENPWATYGSLAMHPYYINGFFETNKINQYGVSDRHLRQCMIAFWYELFKAFAAETYRHVGFNRDFKTHSFLRILRKGTYAVRFLLVYHTAFSSTFMQGNTSVVPTLLDIMDGVVGVSPNETIYATISKCVNELSTRAFTQNLIGRLIVGSIFPTIEYMLLSCDESVELKETDVLKTRHEWWFDPKRDFVNGSVQSEGGIVDHGDPHTGLLLARDSPYYNELLKVTSLILPKERKTIAGHEHFYFDVADRFSRAVV